MSTLEILHLILHLQGIQIARTHELKPYIIFIKPPSIGCMRQTRKNARIITDYYVNMKFKVRFGNTRDGVYKSEILLLEHNSFYYATLLTLKILLCL